MIVRQNLFDSFAKLLQIGRASQWGERCDGGERLR
jgi:hypothetical protein